MKTDMTLSTGYVLPYPQPALGGKLGLTSTDIAGSLGTRANNVTRELGHRGYADRLRSVGCELAPTGAKSKGRGRPGKVWALDTMAAQIYVAQTRTIPGIGYAAYLIRHEAASKKALAKMQSRLDELEAKVEKRHKRHTVVLGTAQIKTLFGEVVETVIEKALLISDMSPEERRAYRIQHLAKIGKGVASKIEQESTFADIKTKLLRVLDRPINDKPL